MANEPLEFFLPCEVVAKQSTRFVQATGRRYTPPKVKENAEMLCALAYRYRPTVPLNGPLRLELVFQYAWRAGETKRNRTRRVMPKATRPDCDNLAKQMCDVLQSVGFFVNDWQVSALDVRKVWTDSPGVQVRLEQDNGTPQA